MSHHLDTPLASQTGQLYIDDLYVFPGEASTVFMMDAPEAMLSLVTNTAVPSGLKPSVTEHQRDSSFPYVVPA